MNETVQFLAQHGYWLLVGAVLARQACIPIPANLFVVAGGALASSGRLSFSGIVSASVITFLFADLAWYEAGRRFGDRILHFVCVLSSDPAPCVHKATAAFARRGVKNLLFSKFVIGLDTVAAPLAGAAGVPATHFLVFDALGALSWSATYATVGYIFSHQLDRVAIHVVRLGVFVTLAIAAAAGFYMARKFAKWYRFVRQFNLARISPEELSDKLKAGEDILLVDLQGRPHHATEAVAIPGAVRINPRRLEQYGHVEMSPSREVVLYCNCPGEFTSARVARALQKKGIQRVRPLAGGLQAWRARGFPVTSEVRVPPEVAAVN